MIEEVTGPESQHWTVIEAMSDETIRHSENAAVVVERTCARLSLEPLRRHLTTELVGHHMYIFNSVDSTNRVLARLADRGAAEGTVVLAEAQTAGRGRLRLGQH